MFPHVRGQFAFALWDTRRRKLILARDRFGICPLYWTRQNDGGGEWLLFASEIKGLLASGLVPRRPDVRGIDTIFTFFALPSTTTCFRGVQALLPSHYLRIQPDTAVVEDCAYWDLEFPDRGAERQGTESDLADQLEARLLTAVDRRLRADVPVVSYLSGGIDSSAVAALAKRCRGEAIPTFTLQMEDPGFDEADHAAQLARDLGGPHSVIRCGRPELLAAYPQLIRAAEAPVSDTCCAALLLLARDVHDHGYKVALTGEGSDESLAGYPWYKWQSLLGLLDLVPGVKLSGIGRRAVLQLLGAPSLPGSEWRRLEAAAGSESGWLILYGLAGAWRRRLYNPAMQAELGDFLAIDDVPLPRARMRRWHPLHRALYLGMPIHLPGLLLSLGGDRVTMNSSVETRYPFLDEDVVEFLAGLAPRFKLRGQEDKRLLRLAARRWLPAAVASRPKTMFQAPFDSLYGDPAPPLVAELLSDEALAKTGYFDAEQVQALRQRFPSLRPGSAQRFSAEIALSAVAATQLWHHIYIAGDLADVPALTASSTARRHAVSSYTRPTANIVR